MNTSSAFLVALWSGLAAPASLYAPIPRFRPAIADLTSAGSFALVTAILGRAFSECVNEQAAITPDAFKGEQLSFDFSES